MFNVSCRRFHAARQKRQHIAELLLGLFDVVLEQLACLWRDLEEASKEKIPKLLIGRVEGLCITLQDHFAGAFRTRRDDARQRPFHDFDVFIFHVLTPGLVPWASQPAFLLCRPDLHAFADGTPLHVASARGAILVPGRSKAIRSPGGQRRRLRLE